MRSRSFSRVFVARFAWWYESEELFVERGLAL
jgi:hypothetical protein